MAFIPAHSTLAGFQPEDDIDTLFHSLSPLEAPGETVTRILAQIRRLPGPLWQRETRELPEHENMDTLVVRNEKRDPS